MNLFKNDQIVLKLVGKLVILVFIIGVLDFGIGSLFEYLFFKQGNNWYASTTYVINDADEDMLVFGSSRANHHYVPDILTLKTGLSCYNAGCDGQSLLYDYALFKSVLAHRKPKKVILELSKFALYFDQANYDRLSHLYPYYRDNETLRQVIDLKEQSSKYIRMSKLYTYNSTILVILKSFVRPRTDFNGYIPYPGDPTLDVSDISQDSLGIDAYLESTAEMRLDENKIHMLNSFIDDALEADIDLYLVESPYFYHQKDSGNISLMKIREILKEKGLKYYNFSNDDIFAMDPGLFGDGIHLNRFGAEKFSDVVADIISVGPGSGISLKLNNE